MVCVQRWVITKNDYITLASEIGVWGYKTEDVVSKGRVGPGQILVVDTLTGKVLDTKDVSNHLKICVRTVNGYATMRFVTSKS